MHHPRRVSSPSDCSPVTSARRAQQAHLGVVQIFRRRPCVKMTLQQSTPVCLSPPRSSTENKGKFLNNVSRLYPRENCSHFQLRLHKTSPPPKKKILAVVRDYVYISLRIMVMWATPANFYALLLGCFPIPRASMQKLRGISFSFLCYTSGSTSPLQKCKKKKSANDLLERLVPRQTTLPVSQACRELHAYFQPKRFQSGGRD